MTQARSTGFLCLGCFVTLQNASADTSPCSNFAMLSALHSSITHVT